MVSDEKHPTLNPPNFTTTTVSMNEKQSHYYYRPGSKRAEGASQPRWCRAVISHRTRRTLRRLCITTCILLILWTSSRSVLAYLTSNPPGLDRLDQQQQQIVLGNDLSANSTSTSTIYEEKSTSNVSFETHIMSKCPDAKACLHELVLPAMEKIHDKVDFELSFIAR